MQYPTPPQRSQAYRPPGANLRQYVVHAKPATIDRLRALLALFPEPQLVTPRRRS
jgi:hypothetical protein